MKISNEIIWEVIESLSEQGVYFSEAEAMKAALSAVLPKLMVKVQQLEWVTSAPFSHEPENKQYADTPFGRILMLDLRGYQQGFGVRLPFQTDNLLGDKKFNTIEQAKTSAQADYERRMLQGLEIVTAATVTDGGTKAVYVAALDENELQEIADGAWGDGPMMRVAARDTIRALSAEPAQSAVDLPWRISDIKRGLILFRTSNNAHGFTNFSMLSERVENLHPEAKIELANIMRNIAHGLSPAEPAQNTSMLFGPYGYLNGNRMLSEDSWEIESDPDDNAGEYFSIPLFSKVDPFKIAGTETVAAPAEPAQDEQSKPCDMETFIEYLTKDVEDYIDRGDAIQCWLNGEYNEALHYLQPQSVYSINALVAPTKEAGR